MSAPDAAGAAPRDREAELFGTLTRRVALDAPVSHAELRRALDCLADRPPENSPVFSESGVTVHFTSATAWHERALEAGVHPACELAVREVHRRLATALGAPTPPPRTDPYVVGE